MTQLVQGDRRKPCCRVPENLNLVSSGPVTVGTVTSTARIPVTETMRRCRVCGCRHFEIAADPGEMKLRGSAA